MRQDRLERPTFGSLPRSARVGARALLCTRHEHPERKLASPGLRGSRARSSDKPWQFSRCATGHTRLSAPPLCLGARRSRAPAWSVRALAPGTRVRRRARDRTIASVLRAAAGRRAPWRHCDRPNRARSARRRAFEFAQEQKPRRPPIATLGGRIAPIPAAVGRPWPRSCSRSVAVASWRPPPASAPLESRSMAAATACSPTEKRRPSMDTGMAGRSRFAIK
jgi:hypothetical protein